MTQTINMVAAALGGEGGGVFTSWVIDIAERENWLCQSTSLAGVAQRTGATIYYLELFPRDMFPQDMAAAKPVMSLFPAQGDIDIAVASEIAEAGRMVQRGFVTKDRTTLIASDHRVYGITEKIDVADGRIDGVAVSEIAERYAKRYVHYDMLALANAHGSVISAVLLGALAGAEVLPFAKQTYVDVIAATGKAVATNSAAFEASYQRAKGVANEAIVEHFEPGSEPDEWILPPAQTAHGSILLKRLQNFPKSSHRVIYHGLEKLVDYQDPQYAQAYLDRLSTVGDDPELIEICARWLALWMCFEDVPRVAQLKIRASRMAAVRNEVRADPGQLIEVTEFFKPRVEEICALLPPWLGKALLGSTLATKFMGLFTGGKQLRTNTVGVFAVLRGLSELRRFRRSMLGFQHEQTHINRWLEVVVKASKSDIGLAREVAKCGRLIKGYGDTRRRTSAQMTSILDSIELEKTSSDQVHNWYTAAVAEVA